MRAQRLLGVGLALGAYLPLHRLLDPARAGPAGLATRTSTEAAWQSGLFGTAIVLGAAVVMAFLLPTSQIMGPARAALDWLGRPGALAFALAAGAIALTLATVAALVLHGGHPTSVDEMAQLLHAQALARGTLAVPIGDVPAALVVQNGVVTPEGWVSIYPPLHTLLLAAASRAGTSWLVGPLAVGVATVFAALSFERTLARGPARVAAALLSVAPFWLLMGGTHLSHTTAAAALALLLWTALRARDGGVPWAVAAGAAAGAAVTARPWVGLVCSAALLGAAWLPRAVRPPSRRAWATRLGALAAGGSPFALLLFWWNARLFGSPVRLGYTAAFGPAHGLGFHRDPWGNAYGALEALAYTGADLVQLGARLLESPLPALALAGVGLAVGRPRSVSPLLTTWVLAAVAANVPYWHHGSHLGPRMLYEATPAWIALFVVGSGELARRGVARGLGAWCVLVTVLGGALLAPGAVIGARAAPGAGASVPEPSTPGRAVVFLHGSWASRVGARLAASGMRRDSIETALRRNGIGAVDRYARWRSNPDRTEPPPLDFEPRPGSPPELETRQLSPGNFVRVAPDGLGDDACAREAAADRLGAVELEPLLWRAPPFPDTDVLVLRDLGPAANAAAASLSDLAWYVYVPGDGRGGPRLLDYRDGMELLWRGAAGVVR